MKYQWVGIILLALAMVIVGAEAGSLTRADRHTDIDVAADQDAYISLDDTNTPIKNGTTGTALTVRNQLEHSVSVKVISASPRSDFISYESLAHDHSSVGKHESVSLGSGEKATIQVRCGDGASGKYKIELRLEAKSSGSSDTQLTIDEEVTVECTTHE
jgi:hypothetical protein